MVAEQSKRHGLSPIEKAYTSKGSRGRGFEGSSEIPCRYKKHSNPCPLESLDPLFPLIMEKNAIYKDLAQKRGFRTKKQREV